MLHCRSCIAWYRQQDVYGWWIFIIPLTVLCVHHHVYNILTDVSTVLDGSSQWIPASWKRHIKTQILVTHIFLSVSNLPLRLSSSKTLSEQHKLKFYFIVILSKTNREQGTQLFICSSAAEWIN